MDELSPWWSPARHQDRRAGLLARQRIMAAVRSYFETRGFIETACGALQASPGTETHLSAVEASLEGPSGAVQRLYLHTSPEFAMKKLIAAGETKIFEFARVFRGREGGPLNAAEFTLLEWYRAEAPYAAVIDDCLQLIRIATDAAGAQALRHGEHTARVDEPAVRIGVAQAFERFAGIDLLATIGMDGGANRDAFAQAARRAGIDARASDTWSDIFSRVMAERVEPNFGNGILVLSDYPRPEAALARISPKDPRIAERFEIFVCGVELANGYGELTDAREQRRRFVAAMNEKERIYKKRYPIDEELLAALDLMPQTSGVALGFDRLVMLATGARSIDEVMWTPRPEPSGP